MYYKARCLKGVIKHEVSYVLYSTRSQMYYKARGLICLIKHDVSNVLYVQLVDGKDLYALEAFLESFPEFLLENSSSLCTFGAIVNCALRLRGCCLWPETPLEMYTPSWGIIAAETSKINQLLRLEDAFSLLRATKASSDTSPRCVFCFRWIQKYTPSRNFKQCWWSPITLLGARLSRKLYLWQIK